MSSTIQTKSIYYCSFEREMEYREKLFETSRDTDCEFLVGRQRKKFQCHRFLLTAASHKMEVLLKNGTKEPIKIPDIEPEVFRELLRAIYLHKIEIGSPEFAFNLAKVGQTYGIPSIREHCLNHVRQSNGISIDTVIAVLEFHDAIENSAQRNETVEKECWNLICTQAAELFASEAFLKAKPSTVVAIFSRDDLKISSDLVLVDAIYRYAKYHNALPICAKIPEADQDKFNAIILPAMKHIRFLSIPLEDIYRSITLPNLLRAENFSGIASLKIAPDSDYHRRWYPMEFSTNSQPRCAYVPVVACSSNSVSTVFTSDSNLSHHRVLEYSDATISALETPKNKGTCNGVETPFVPVQSTPNPMDGLRVKVIPLKPEKEDSSMEKSTEAPTPESHSLKDYSNWDED